MKIDPINIDFIPQGGITENNVSALIEDLLEATLAKPARPEFVTYNKLVSLINRVELIKLSLQLSLASNNNNQVIRKLHESMMLNLEKLASGLQERKLAELGKETRSKKTQTVH